MTVATLPISATAIRIGDPVTCLDTGERGFVLATRPERPPLHAWPRLDAGDGQQYLVQRGGYTQWYGRHEIAPCPRHHDHGETA